MNTKNKNRIEIITYGILLIIIIGSIYLFTKNKESFVDADDEEVPVSRTGEITGVPLRLCDNSLDNQRVNDELTSSIAILYKNHYRKNIKKYINNYNTLQTLTDKINRINKKMQDNMHSGQTEFNFV